MTQEKEKDILAQAVEQVRNCPIPSGPSEELLQTTLTRLATMPPHKNSQLNAGRIRFMKTTFKFAAAAVVLIICGVLFYRVTGSLDGATPAFAKVLEEVKKVKSVCYKKTLWYKDNPPFTTTDMINEDGVQRNEFSFGAVQVFDFKNGIQLSFNPESKSAYRDVRTPQPQFKTYNALDFLATEHEKHAQFVGEEILNGMQTYLYKNTSYMDCIIDKIPNITYIWVDPKTNLPVRVEKECVPTQDPNYLPPKDITLHSSDFGASTDNSMSGGLSGSCTPEYTKEVMTDFQWNVDLDPALFSTEMPANYTVQHEEIVSSEPKEFHLLETLKLWAEMSNDSLPLDVKEMMDPNTMQAMLIKKFAKGIDPQEEYHQACDFMTTVRWAASFAEENILKKNWFAATEPVFLGEAEKPLYWWKIENSDLYRVIYGDLTIDDCNQPPRTETGG